MIAPVEPVMFVHSFPSGLGWMALRGTESGLVKLVLGHADQAAAIAAVGESNASGRKTLPRWMKQAAETLQAYSHGAAVDLQSIPLDLEHRTPFEERVRDCLMRVGYGRTVSYGELAELAGAPRAARAVGTVMSRNPVPLVIPCHRVLGAGGKLGGYSAPTGLTLKRKLLKLESAQQ